MRRPIAFKLFLFWELGRRECVYYAFPLQGENDRNYEFVCMGVGGEEKRVCVYYDFSLSSERRIEIMNSFLWELGGRREKSVCVYYDFSLSWERRIEIMNSFLWELGGEEKRVCVFIMISLSPGRGG